MSTANQATTEYLLQVYRRAEAAGHGKKQAVYEEACEKLQVGMATLYRAIDKVAMKKKGKKRSDAGKTSLTRDEALVISGILIESQRKNGKRLMSIADAVEIARSNSLIKAERMDAATGEVKPLSVAAVGHALKVYGLHPNQLNQATLATELRSEHPNHVWQIDASLCVMYYLNTNTPKQAGLQVMCHKKFYKNKPKNLKKIENDRVWSYEITDHASGAIFVHYVLGAESGTNLAESFIKAIQKRPNDPFHGVPNIIYMDMGSANTSGLSKNLFRRLEVNAIAHAANNAQATGQVENARNIIERSLESGLKFQPVHSIDELNALAARWQVWFNSHKKHSRHGMTRYAAWMTIKEEQLRVAPPVELCRELLTHAPEQRKVTNFLTISFKGNEYDVSDVPNVQAAKKLDVTYNPWHPEKSAMVIEYDDEGNEKLHPIALVERNELGMRTDAPVIGESFAPAKDTLLEKNRKEVERVVMQASTDEEAEAKRKAKALPFGGELDPYKRFDDAPKIDYIPRKGEQMQPAVVTQPQERVLNYFETAKEMAGMGCEMTREKNALIKKWYPDGAVPEADLDKIKQRLETRGTLQVVGGKAVGN